MHIRLGVTLLDQRTLQVILTILVVAAALGFVWMAWQILAAFLFAVFFAYLVHPVTQFVARRTKLSRGKAIGVVYLIVLAALIVLFLFIGPKMLHEAKRLTEIIPQLYEKVASGQIAWQLGAQHGWSYDTRLRIQQFLAAHNSDIAAWAQEFAVHLARLGRQAWWLVLIPMLAVFFLKDGDQLSQSLLEVFERRRQREFIAGLMNDVHRMLALYIRGQLILAAVAMVAYVIGLGVLRVPYSTILGVIGGFWEFIPMVGPLISALLIVGVALGAGFAHLLPLVLFLAILRLAQDYVIAPRIMSGQLQLHPLAILFGVLAGAEVAGIIGVYLSIPVMAAVRIFWRRWTDYLRREASEMAEVRPLSGRDAPQPASRV